MEDIHSNSCNLCEVYQNNSLGCGICKGKKKGGRSCSDRSSLSVVWRSMAARGVYHVAEAVHVMDHAQQIPEANGTVESCNYFLAKLKADILYHLLHVIGLRSNGITNHYLLHTQTRLGPAWYVYGP